MSALHEVVFGKQAAARDDQCFVFMLKVLAWAQQSSGAGCEPSLTATSRPFKSSTRAGSSVLLTDSRAPYAAPVVSSCPQVAGSLPLFGVCCCSLESVHRPPHLARHHYPSCRAPFRSCMIAAPRVYCLLSHYPFFDLHFQVRVAGPAGPCAGMVRSLGLEGKRLCQRSRFVVLSPASLPLGMQVLNVVLGMERLHRTIDYNAELDGGPGAMRSVASNVYGTASNNGGGGGGGATASSVGSGPGGSGGGAAAAAPGGGGGAQGAGSQLLRQYCKECAAVIADMYPGVLLQQQLQHAPLPVRRTNSGRVVATVGSADGGGGQAELAQHTTHTYLATGPGAALGATGGSGGGGGLGLGLGSPPAAALSMETTLGGLLSEPSSRQPLLSHHGSVGVGGAPAGAGALAGASNGAQQQGAPAVVPQSPRLLGAGPSPRMGADRQARCQVGGLGSCASRGFQLAAGGLLLWEEGLPLPACISGW